jgi:hypothetical protein
MKSHHALAGMLLVSSLAIGFPPSALAQTNEVSSARYGLKFQQGVRVHDPFIVAHQPTKTYYLYTASGLRQELERSGVFTYACRTSAIPSRGSASPASRACCAATRWRRWKTSPSGTSHSSSQSSASHPGFIPPHGGYENLLAYRKSQIIFDATARFCDHFIDRRSRTHDQMPTP